MKHMKKIVWTLLMALLLAANLAAAAGTAAAGDKAEDLFLLGKNAVHDKQWQDAVSAMGRVRRPVRRKDPRGAPRPYTGWPTA